MDDRPPAVRTDDRQLVGRGADLRLLASVLGGATDGALLLTSEPGVGKSALLEQACRDATASGARVLRAAGVEFEAEVSFAGLHQLLVGLLDELADLNDLHRDALAVVLGTGAGPPPDRLVVHAAALALLHRAARSGPLLVAVEDAHWLDRSSALVLGFVARRLAGHDIRFLAAARTGSDSPLLHAGLPRREVPPLAEGDAVRLLGLRYPGLAAPVRRWVVAAAQGNPLALLELPASMTEAQRAAAEPLPAFLALGDRLQAVFADRLRRLPAETLWLLLLMALDGTGDLRALVAAAPGDDRLDGLEPAERTRLVRVDTTTDRVLFRHPLIAAAVVGSATSAERRRAHAVLAGLPASDPERRAWHLAEAVVGPDEPAAELLEQAAHRTLRKGDAVRAVHALLRAADLSPRAADRARRLAAAAYVGADAAGRLASVPHLLGEARRVDGDTGGSLEVAVAAAHHLLNGEGDVDTAHLVLAGAIEGALDRGRTGSAAPVEDALHTLLMICHFSGRAAPWAPLTSALARLGDAVSPLLAVSARTCGDPARARAVDLDRLDALLAAVDGEADPTRIVRTGVAAFHVDRLPACREALQRVVRDGRDGGAAGSAVQALMLLGYDAFLEGRWDEAADAAREGVAWSERLGYRLVALPGLYCLALLAAARGEEERTRAVVGELVARAAPRGAAMVEQFAARAGALAALGRCDYEEAYRLAASVSPPGRLAPHVPLALWVAPDLVEAAVRTGRTVEAVAHVAAMREAEVFRRQPRFALLATASAALVATGDEADRLFRGALAVRGGERFPFERARVQLQHGEHLRRARAVQAARAPLASALAAFERLGAPAWAARARHELRTGRRARDAPHGVPLTAQEHHIASLAAAGLSNKQIGTRLHLSPRTVSGHLYRAFPKLGVTTRAALRDALTGSGVAADDGAAPP